MHVLVTGATGYVGGRLVPRLLEAGHRVRVLVRDPSRLEGRPWAGQVEVVRGSLEDPQALHQALLGVEAAYYLVHAMLSEREFQKAEERQARVFAQVAQEVGLRHVIYLGGLLPKEGRPSPHLQSRARVGEILRAHLPVTEFRAGPIVGSGSASFEMVRYLTERLPVMVAPRWVLNPVSPIAVRDVLAYLLLALSRGPAGVVEIGAPPLTFKGMMEAYARVRGLRRLILPVPVLAPRLAALWVGLVTPIPNRLALPLVEGILHPLVADTGRAQALFPEVRPLPYEEAVALALRRIALGEVETRWSGALHGRAYFLEDREGVIREVRSLRAKATPEALFRVFTSLGGERGWLVWSWAWALRGLLDRMVGGPGLRRGRRHPQELLPGEAVDFWRVERVEPGRLLRLRAEMRLPGKAWLEWQALPEGEGARLVQTAYFEPVGLTGFLYWWLLYPLHRRIFSDLARAIVREAEGALAKPPSPGRGAG
ncbi:SDR family oxidoreductase [Thermus tengchongensis]|uniref:SDR family oxidoreductase n=1 Tax=Thermus tengchongensis TaxID=1214928 RepID=A0ABY2KCN1_9DEIN|nr:SDR family oxidoreductase [Thermus tengchongensis]TFU17515.1 SDR family oxidoreductase [Thermus tengchongensis]